MAATPSVIGRYQIRSRLGEGGMGVVYLAHDPAMDSDIAIKLLRSPMADDALRKRFAREAMMARRVGVHPNVVTIFDIGEHEGDPFIAMEYVSGETLEHMIRRQALPPPTRRLQMVEDLCTGLSHAHKAGLVHRDIKPANVMLSDDGTVKILDFGVARAAESDLTADGMVIGALNYMSPEQMTGSGLDARSDVFAVGALFYELLSGRRAFPGSIREGLPYRIIHGMPPPLGEVVADLDPDIERIILRALEKDPAKRYQDVVSMRQDIARVRRRLEHVQIERALTHAREAFDTGDYEAVVASCAEVTTIDPDEPRALDLLQRTEEARTGEHASEATVLSSERPTVALRVPGPPPAPVPPAAQTAAPTSPSGSTPVPPAVPVPSGSSSVSAISGVTPVPGVTPMPQYTVPQAAPPSRLRPLAIATMVIAASLVTGAFAWMIGRFGSSRTPDATAVTRNANPAPPAQSQPPRPATTPPATQRPAPSQGASVPSTSSQSEETPAQSPLATPPATPSATPPSVPSQAQASAPPDVETPAAPAQSTPVRATNPPARAAASPASAPTAAASPSASTAGSANPTESEAEGDSSAQASQAAQGEGDAPRPGEIRRSPYERPYGPRGGFGGRDGSRYGRRGEMSLEEEEIRRTMRAFQSAWDRLDLQGVRRVFPSFVPGPQQPYQNYTIEFQDVRVFVNGSRASVHALVRHVLRSRLGGSSRPDQVIYRLEQQGNGRWIMNGMQRVR